jgi:hypothetical protein
MVGYEPQTVVLSASQTTVSVTLKESVQNIQEVVVTALGVKKDKKPLLTR